MTDRDARFRRLLWAYPKAYRDARGDEIVSTMLDATPPDRRGPRIMDVLDVLVHGTKERVAEARSVTLDLAQPPTYQSASMVLLGSPRGSISSERMARELRSLTATPVRARAASLLHHPLPSCSAAALRVSNIVTVSCAASRPREAAAAANSMIAAYDTVTQAATIQRLTHLMVSSEARGQTIRRSLGVTTQFVHSLSRTNPAFGTYVELQKNQTRELARATARSVALYHALLAPSVSVRVLERARPNDLALGWLSTSDVSTAALAGLAIGLVLALARRREARVYPSW